MTDRVPLDFRLALPADAAAIVRLVNAAYRGDEGRAGWTHEMHLIEGPRTDEDEVRRLVAMPDTVMLLGVVEGAIAASVLLQRQGDAAYFGMFVVLPQLQAAGLGRRMIAAAEDFAWRTWDARRLTLTAIHLRPELIAYYERRGFRRTGELVPFPAEAAARAKVEGIELAVLEKPLAMPSA